MSRERNRPPRPPDEAAASFDEPFGDERLLQGYLAHLMTMQDERQDVWLEEADLQQAARDLGLSDDDLQRLEAATDAHRRRGRSFAERGLWDEAVEAFRQATVLRPLDAEVAYELAQAHLGRWRTSGDEAARQGAERYAHRALDLDAEHAGSYEILQELKRRPARTAGPSQAEVKTSMGLLFGALVVAAVLILALLALFLL